MKEAETAAPRERVSFWAAEPAVMHPAKPSFYIGPDLTTEKMARSGWSL